MSLMVIKNNRGFSLLELLLAVAIMAGLTTGAAVIFDDWARERVNRQVAAEMQDFQNAVEEYVKFNFTEITNDIIPNFEDLDEIALNDLIFFGYLPVGYEARNSFRQSLKAFVRRVEDSVNGPVVEVITVSDDLDGNDSRMNNKRLFAAAAAGGPQLGIVSGLDLGGDCCVNEVRSIHGSWVLPLSEFGSLYNPAPNVTNGGYMAAYNRISVRDIADNPYLYRIEIEGSPEVNKMTANLDLNGNDVLNAGVIISDSSTIGGNANFGGVESNNLQSAYVLSVRDDLDVGLNLTILADGVDKGEVIIRGDNTTNNDLIVPGTVNVQIDGGPNRGSLAASEIFTSNLNDPQTATFVDAGLGTGNVDAGNIFVTDTITRGNIQTQSLQTSNAQDVSTMSAANAVAASTTLNGNATISGNVNADGNIAVSGSSTLNGTVTATNQASIDNLNCTSGCP